MSKSCNSHIRIFYLTLLIHALSGCKNDKFDKIDDHIIHDLSKKSIGNYDVGDTIIFKSNRNHSHSVKITRIDTMFYKTPGFSILAGREDQKEISLYILELDGTDKHSDPGVETKFISVDGTNSGVPSYDIWISYKDFMEELPLSKTTDTIIEKSVYRKPEPEAIVKLYWTQDNGLTGYETADGETYRLWEPNPGN